MPSIGRSRMTDTERIKIAQGKLAGKTARQIAADTGLSESSVEKASKDPRTSLLIQRLKERDEEVLGRCWKKAVGEHREPSGFRRSRSGEGCAQRSASLRDGRRSATDQNGGSHQGSQRRFHAG